MPLRPGSVPTVSRSSAAGWISVALVAAYLAIEDGPWRVPMPGGLPLLPVWIVAVVVALGTLAWTGRRIDPPIVLATMAIAAAILFDATFFEGVAFRDLGIYLRAGASFRLGQPVYLDHLVTSLPPDPTTYPFLYPPPALPFAAVLSLLPQPLVTLAWEAALLGAAIAGLRLLGLDWRWTAAMLAWPPFAQGLYVGNVALPLFLLFVLGPWLGAGLVAGALLKPQAGLAGLWLVREGHWRQLGLGVAFVTGVVLLTAPVTGLDPWRAWLDGLAWFSRSQPFVPRTFYGFALGEYLPAIEAFGLGAMVTVLAVTARGRPGLARLGVATVVASPSLYAHGFTVALPALLELDAVPFWVAIALTSVSGGPAWFAALAIVVAGWFVPALRRPAPEPGDQG